MENIAGRWYALRVRSQHEQMVGAHLQGRGYKSFLPLYKSRRRWSDRFKEIEQPLFPGYVFCQFNPLNQLPILSIPGVVHVVGVGRTPVQPWPFLRVGHKVRIEYGPLSGLEGILLGFGGHQRLVLSVTLLQRSVAVQVDEAWVRPVLQERPARSDSVTSQTCSSQLTA